MGKTKQDAERARDEHVRAVFKQHMGLFALKQAGGVPKCYCDGAMLEQAYTRGFIDGHEAAVEKMAQEMAKDERGG